MKNILLIFTFFASSITMNGQEAVMVSNEANPKKNVSTKLPVIASIEKNNDRILDKVCYGEISKVTFYEALISQNGFNINLKNSNGTIIKNTEEIMLKKNEEKLYSEKN